MKLQASQDALREETVLYERLFTVSSVHFAAVPVLLCLRYKPSLTKLGPGSDVPRVRFQ